MGYWGENADATQVWGDDPADVMDDALAKIVAIFQRDLGRRPTRFELRRGLEFAVASPEFDTPDVT